MQKVVLIAATTARDAQVFALNKGLERWLYVSRKEHLMGCRGTDIYIADHISADIYEMIDERVRLGFLNLKY